MKIRILVVVICMLIVAIALPVCGIFSSEETKKPLFFGNTLYVGGDGPGNYTKIQDAIDDSSDGDFIFVFDDSSPYIENLVVDKSVNLKGENKNSTFIFGDESSDGIIVNITADYVNISGFSIQPYSGKPAGITVYKNYKNPDYWNIEIIQNVTIFNNIIKNTGWAGIFGIRLHNGSICGNIIENSLGSGVHLFISSNNNIKNNIITNSAYRGIEIHSLWRPSRIKNYLNPTSENNMISNNIIKSSRWGIALYSGPINTNIIENIISDIQGNYPGSDGIGIYIYQASKTQILRNTFIDNSLNAYFEAVCPIRYSQFLRNSWDNNYWGEAKSAPVRINGALIFIPFPRLPFGISFPNYDFNYHELNWVAVDWHPSKESCVI